MSQIGEFAVSRVTLGAIKSWTDALSAVANFQGNASAGFLRGAASSALGRITGSLRGLTLPTYGAAPERRFPPRCALLVGLLH